MKIAIVNGDWPVSVSLVLFSGSSACRLYWELPTASCLGVSQDYYLTQTMWSSCHGQVTLEKFT